MPCKQTKRVPKQDFINVLRKLCGPCHYRMLQITIKQMEHEKIFPFVKVGRLTLTYDENKQLTKINLEECAEHAAMETYNKDPPVAT